MTFVSHIAWLFPKRHSTVIQNLHATLFQWKFIFISGVSGRYIIQYLPGSWDSGSMLVWRRRVVHDMIHSNGLQPGTLDHALIVFAWLCFSKLNIITNKLFIYRSNVFAQGMGVVILWNIINKDILSRFCFLFHKWKD